VAGIGVIGVDHPLGTEPTKRSKICVTVDDLDSEHFPLELKRPIQVS
jgi:hypothetical protein